MKVFLDTCVWFIAIKNSCGIGGRIVDLGLKDVFYEIVVSKQVSVETARKLKEKIDISAVQAFNYIISKRAVEAIAVDENDIEEWRGVISETDAHVLAATKKAGADVLVTVDGHFFTPAVKKHFPIQVFKPKDFLEWFEKQLCKR